MKALHIDFGLSAGRRRRPLAWVLLVVALIWLAWEGHQLRNAWYERVALQEQRSQLQSIQDAAQPKTEEGLAAISGQQAAMARVALRLQAPWARLFTSVESAGNGQVALLGLEPDLDSLEIRIQAEAKDLQALLGYVRRLGETSALASARLESHQVHLQDPYRPVQGTIVAHWRSPPAALPSLQRSQPSVAAGGGISQ